MRKQWTKQGSPWANQLVHLNPYKGENVDEVEIVAAISGLLGRIPGYRWERMVVCPFVNYGEPVRRRRSFWVGRRLS